MSTFSPRNAIVRYCQVWRDLTAAEVSQFHATKIRATCHRNKGHAGHHHDKILGLAWKESGWPRSAVYACDGVAP